MHLQSAFFAHSKERKRDMVAEGILVNGVTEILKKLTSVLANEITLIWDVNHEFENLQSTLNMILAVIEDAEKKQVSNEVVRLWMQELKFIAYDAEDILDDYSYEIIGKCTQTEKVGNPSLFFCWRMAHKIKKINEKFNKIAKRKNNLGLQTIDVGSSSSSHTMMENRETYSLVAANWKIVGRENDKSNIINTLLDKDSCLVFSIVGLGGLGKTTMAQLVYNDEAITKHFQLKIWVCVSDPFDVKKLLKTIVNSTRTGEKYDDAATMDDIAHGLQYALTEKKFLLVLDDVWNENSDYWNILKSPLMVGAEGSKILVTTRSVEVASIMVDKFPPYPLGILNPNDSWSLFKEMAFGYVVGAIETPKLVEIGKEMVKRCGGLPLAVIFLGSLMRSKKTEEEWKNIRDTKIWHESREGKKSKHRILPSLKLSYDYLPSSLKQCFSYCCLFPKDWEILRETLIRLWMAEGFLIESPGENSMSMEEIGNEYFHHLLSNFFFQDVKRNEDGNIVTCKMHDLVHDLARSVVGKNECLIVENVDDIDCISKATIRLTLNLVNVDEDIVPKVLEALKDAKNLRTIFVNYPMNLCDIEKVINKNKRLRVLDLRGFNYRKTPPSSIGELKHLRYLHLPETFTIPKGIGRLRFLQTLNDFKLGRKKKNAGGVVGGIEELEGLNHLRGDLSISDLQNVTSETAACRANLKEKKKLHGLNLSWNGNGRYPTNNHQVVMEGLRPPPSLKTLAINDFEGTKLSSWIIQDSSFCLPNLVELTLFNCKCEQLAGFGALPSLKSLILFCMKKMECIGNELYYSAGTGTGSSSSSSSTRRTTIVAFPSLKTLSLLYMYSLKEWVVPAVPPQASTTTGATTTNYCFPLLEEITIHYCPLLTTITPTTTMFPSLKVLYLLDIDGRAAETLVTNNLNSLTTLRLREIPGLISLPCQDIMENNNTLLSLEISYCPEFKGFHPLNMDDDDDQEGGEQLRDVISQVVSSSSSSSSLQSLKLYECPALRFYPNIRSLTSLQKLVIQDGKESRSLQDHLTCLSSSSSPEYQHLAYVKILKKKTDEAEKEEDEEEVFVWRKSSFFEGMNEAPTMADLITTIYKTDRSMRI